MVFSVYITTVTMQYTWFYEAVPQEGTGSGVIIDQQGHVLTNYHVVKGADKISITLADGTEVEGRVTGTDPENDIAVVQFDPHGKALTTIPFGNSSTLKVGMKVLAIGNPFGLDRTLTRGVVSGWPGRSRRRTGTSSVRPSRRMPQSTRETREVRF